MNAEPGPLALWPGLLHGFLAKPRSIRVIPAIEDRYLAANQPDRGIVPPASQATCSRPGSGLDAQYGSAARVNTRKSFGTPEWANNGGIAAPRPARRERCIGPSNGAHLHRFLKYSAAITKAHQTRKRAF
jgi:hypothetical protein